MNHDFVHREVQEGGIELNILEEVCTLRLCEVTVGSGSDAEGKVQYLPV